MADYIRRAVSGNKARFKDTELDLELDLVYVTDQVIIMGYPSTGFEGIYRNRREDAKKFLEHRHPKNYWVFNMCPIKENSYPASFFDGRVSRYPFPDHHVPPLPFLPLISRQMNAWLSGSPQHVAVLHCKAGKGRSGTMACAYLLSLKKFPTPPRLHRNYTPKEWAELRAEGFMDVIPEAVGTAPLEKQPLLSFSEDSSEAVTPASTQTSSNSFADSLTSVLDLHTSKRMKPSSSTDKTVRQGVSIPSQRRWLLYWALLLAGEAPSVILPISASASISPPKIQLTEIVIRLKEPSKIKKGLVRATTIVINRANMGKATSTLSNVNAHSQVWVSLARYDDEFVGLLEEWERFTRGENNNLGQYRNGSDRMKGKSFVDIFAAGKWDSDKMIRSFARMGALDDGSVETHKEEGNKVITCSLKPLSDQSWMYMKEGIEAKITASGGLSMPKSETTSLNDQVVPISPETGVLLDATREVRIKLYIGEVLMGWLWFIPAFHMTGENTKFVLVNKEIDFAFGIGSDIIDIEIYMESMPAEYQLRPRRSRDESTGALSAAIREDTVSDKIHAVEG